MRVNLQTRPELLRGWMDDLSSPGFRPLQLPPDQVRQIAEDALAAHKLQAALAELVACKEIKHRFERLQPSAERAALVLDYMTRLGPAWDAAFALLGKSALQS